MDFLFTLLSLPLKLWEEGKEEMNQNNPQKIHYRFYYSFLFLIILWVERSDMLMVYGKFMWCLLSHHYWNAQVRYFGCLALPFSVVWEIYGDIWKRNSRVRIQVTNISEGSKVAQTSRGSKKNNKPDPHADITLNWAHAGSQFGGQCFSQFRNDLETAFSLPDK